MAKRPARKTPLPALVAPLTLLAVLLASIGAAAGRTVPFEVRDSCTTGSTGASGKRDSCQRAICYEAPGDDSFIVESSLTLTKHDGRGSEHWCGTPHVTERKPVIVTLPSGLQTEVSLPTKACLQAHARGPSGHFSGRGRIECSLHGELSFLD